MSLKRLLSALLIWTLSTAPANTANAQFGGGFGGKSKPQPKASAPAIAEKPDPSKVNGAIPKSAVTKGSFTVWTVPKDPKPGEQYRIMIQLKLKSNVERIRRSDIQGSIIGTDGYKDYFGGPTAAGYYEVKDQRVRFDVLVPGAAQLVQDEIHVKSKLLKEEQKIKLKF